MKRDNTAPIRIFIIEDHPVVISGLTNLFRPSRDRIFVKEFSSTIEDVINKADPDDFDIFILELYLQKGKPLDNLASLKRNFPHKPVIIFTVEESNIWRRKSFKTGADAFITKHAGKKEIKYIIQNIVTSNRYRNSSPSQ